MLTVSPNQAYKEIVHCIKVGLVPLLTGSPGTSKSAIVHKIAKDFKLKLIDVRLSSRMPEDISGYPMRNGNKATFFPFDIFPTDTDQIPEGYNGWLLFFDELTSATKPMQAAAYQPILDHMVGSFKLHKNCFIVAAGNKITDNAVVNQMSTALQSRVIHYELEVSHKEFNEHAIQNDYDHRVTGFINYLPSRLTDFRPDHTDKTFACPRTWEFVSRLVKGEDITAELLPRIAGAIGRGVAQEFITFAQEYHRIPKMAEILSRPETLDIPKEASTKYATISMLMENFTPESLDQIILYLKRFGIELQIVFCRGAVARQPKLRATHKGFSEYLSTMTDSL
jgi:hypothetical protein